MKIILASLVLGLVAVAVESRSAGTSEWIELPGTITQQQKDEFLATFNTPLREGRIAFGQRAAQGQFPWQAWLHLLVGGGGMLVCGGTLVTTNHIVTAAHCLPGSVQAVDTHFGSIDRGHFPNVARAGSFLLHHLWESPGSRNLEHDLAIVHIVQQMWFRTAALPTRGSMGNSYINARMTASGFGGDETGNLSQFLMFTWMTGEPNSACGNNIDGMLCTVGDHNSQVRGGDSGGPLIHGDNTLVGVISFGVGSRNGYTRTDRYLDWLGQHTGLQIW